MNRTPVLSEEALNRLREYGEPVTSDGGSLWISLSAISSSPSSKNDTTKIHIPQYLESVQALEFLGFAPAPAQEILDRFNSAFEEHPHAQILDYATDYVRSAPDGVSPEDDWEGALESMGVKESLKDSILNPSHADIRMTETASYWVLDTMDAKNAWLKGLNSDILTPGVLEARLGGDSEGEEEEEGGEVSVSESGENESSSEPQTAVASVDTMTASDEEVDLIRTDHMGKAPPRKLRILGLIKRIPTVKRKKKRR